MGLSDFFDHIDGSAGAFFSAHTTSFAIIIIHLVSKTGTQFDNGIVGTDAITGIALKAIPT
jgi:hypothetical protein